MIPKIIHYCWFGKGPMPELLQRCMQSWKKYCPDYEIKRWDESNFDININTYSKQAYDCKKYAFVSDVARVFALYNYGGIYLDTDVELLKNLDGFLDCQAFSGFQSPSSISTAIMACEKGFPLFKEFFDYYENNTFINPNQELDMTTNVRIFTNICMKYGFVQNNVMQTVSDMVFYPSDYFSPKNCTTKIITLTDNSVAIHHFDVSWVQPEVKLLGEYCGKFGGFWGRLFFIIVHSILALKVQFPNKKKY